MKRNVTQCPGVNGARLVMRKGTFFKALFGAMLLMTCLKGFSQTNGIYESYAILSLNGGANAFYDMNAATANPDFQGATLGSFNSSNSLVVKGGQNKTFKCSGGDITGGNLNYRVWLTSAGASGTFTAIPMSFVSNDAGGCGGNQTWQGTGGTTNIISGLTTPGNYTIEVYSDAPGFPSTAFSSNGGANYKATFNFCGPTSGALPAGNYAIPGCFATLASAITYLNTNGVSGAVQFDVAAGYTETAPVGGFVITATGTSTNTIKFVKSGAGTNPTFTAFTPQVSGTKTDAVIKIVGGDYITLDGLTVQENASNTTTAGATNNMTEVGIGLWLTTATNGAQNNTIQNCTITMGSTYQNAVGIFSSSSSSSTNTALAATATTGTNSNNKFYSNTISSVAYGMYFICEPVTSTILEAGNDIGGSSASTANTITFGNSTVSDNSWTRFSTTIAGGIVFRNGVGNSVRFNNITSNSLSYSAQSAGVAGVFISSGTAPASGTYTSTFSDNTINLTNTGTTPMTGIDFGHGISTGTIVGSTNNITINQTATAANSAAATAIKANYSNATLTSSSNTIVMNLSESTGTMSGTAIAINAAGAGTTLTSSSNTITINQTTTGTGSISSSTTGITVAASATTINGSSNGITVNQTGGGTGTITSTLTGLNVSGAATTINALTNTILFNQTTSVATGITTTITGISATAAATTLNITTTNAITVKQGFTGSGTYGSAAITYVDLGSVGHGTVNVVSNSFNTTGSTIRSAGTLTGVNQGSTTITTLVNVKSNTLNVDRVATSGSVAFFTQTSTTPNDPADTLSANTITFTNLAGTTSGIIIQKLGGSTTAVRNVCNNTISVSGTNTGSMVAISGGYSTTSNIRSNAITISGASTVVTGITVNSNNTTSSIVNNSFSLTSSSTSPSSMTGISLAGSGGHAVTSNSFTAMNFTGSITTSPTVSAIALSAGASASVSSNIINNISTGANSSIAAATVDGVLISGGTSISVFKNKIYGLNTGASANGTIVSGIRISGSTTSGTYNIYNNLIGELTTPTVSSTDAIRGINISNTGATTTTNVYYNTVYLAATSSGINFGSSGIYHVTSATSTTAALNLRNNVIVNGSTPNGGGKAVAYQRSSTTLTNYASTSNNNDFYGTSGLFFDGTNTDVTLGAYKSRVSTRDAASISENPTWQSTSGANANFLKYDVSVGTGIESGGAGIGSSPFPAPYNDDYTGTIRFGSTGYVTCSPTAGTAPDMGAWELCGTPAAGMTYVSSTTTQANTSTVLTNTTNQEVIGIQIVTTGTTSPLSATSFTINTNGTTSTANIANAKIFYTGNSSTFATTTQFGSTNASPSGSFAVTGTQTLSSGTNYFWVTYDVLCGATPGNVIDAECNSLTVGAAQTPTVQAPSGSRTIAAGPLTGTYTVGTGGNYTTLTAAVADINTKGLGGNTTLNILNSITEAGAITINQWAECGGSGYTLTIKPNTTATLSAAVSSGAFIILNGADRVTIDGSNSGGTDRSLTFTNTATTAPTVISIVSLGTGTGATNNTVKNCNISTGVATTIGYGISVGGSTPGTTGADNDNVTIQNNSITVAPIGIYAAGTASVTSGGDDNLLITGNTIDYNATLASIGIQVGNALTSTISLNTISEQTSVAQAPTAISLETGFVSSTVTRNTITKSLNTNSSGYGGRGITVGTGTATSNLTISNNFVAGVNGTNFSSFTNSSSMGICIGTIGNSSTLTTTAGGINLYYNSVSMTGSMGSGSTSAITAAIYVGTGATALDIRNNIFSSTQVATSTTQKNYAIYSAAANTAYTTINYNDYYVTNTFNTASAVLGFLSSDRTTLAAIQTGFGGNVNSQVADPAFTSTTNLHIPAATSSILESGGTAIGGITTDIDGDTRPGPAGSTNGGATAPDIGADEFDGTPIAANDMKATAFIDPTNGGSKVLNVAFSPQASFTNNGTATQTNVTVRYRIVNPSAVEVYNQTAVIASIAPGVTTTITFSSATLTPAGSYTIFAKSELAGDAITGNDQISGTLTVTDPYTSSTTSQNTNGVGINTTNQQVIGISVVVGTSATATSFSLNTNGTTSPSTDITNAKLYYTGTTSTFSAVGQFGSTVASPNGSFSFTGTQALTSGTNYFWLTYDIPSGATLGNLVDGECTSLTINGVSRTPTVTAPTGARTIVGPMSGTYLIGATQTFPNFVNLTAANTDLGNRGVSGPVIFELQSNYSSTGETFPIAINAFSGASSTNTLTIKPGSGVTSTISGSSSVAIIKLNGADYVTIDGSNNGTTTKNLNITNTNSGTSSAVVWLASTASDGATNNTVKNSTLTGNASTTTLGGIVSSGSTIGAVAEVANSANTYQNNTISLSYYGIATVGPTASQSGTAISSNAIGTVTNALGFGGMFISNDNAAISGNTVQNVVTTAASSGGIILAGTSTAVTITGNTIKNVSSTSTGSGTTSVAGIYIGATNTNTVISGNTLTGIASTTTSGYGARGIIVLGNATVVRNNMISDVYCYSDDSNIYWPIGLDIDGAASNVKVYFNSINLFGSHTPYSTATTPAAAALFVNSTGTSLDIRDNILTNSYDASGLSGDKSYAIYSTGTANTQFSPVMDYNDYSVSGTPGVLGNINATDRTTLTAIQTGFGGNTNSKNIAPVYTSTTDLHLNPASNGTLNNLGTTISGITTDIDGATRNLTAPDMGADEFMPANTASWIGGISVLWSTTGNWEASTTPTSTTNVTVPSSASFMPQLQAASTTINNLVLTGSSSIVDLNGKTFVVNGAISGSGTLSGSATSSLTLGGTAGTVNFTSGARTLKDLVLSASASATLGTALDITGGSSFGSVTVNTGATLNTGGALTFKSDANGTARVAPSAGTINGNVIAEQYIPSKRAWRFMSGYLVGGQQYIKDAWQEGQTITTAGQVLNNNPGYGTHITGGTSANGFDQTLTNNYSIRKWTPAATSGWSVTPPPTASTYLQDNNGYALFVRGSRGVDLTTNTSTDNTTLRVTGTVNLGSTGFGTQAFSTTSGFYQLIGNPYISAVDFASGNMSKSGIENKMWFWDPKQGTVGGYVVMDLGTNTASTTTPSYPAFTSIVESGQAFFVRASAGSSSVAFAENAKGTSNTNVYRPKPMAKWHISLQWPVNQDSILNLDGVTAVYAQGFNQNVTQEDAGKLNNFTENVAFRRDTFNLAIEKRPLFTQKDTLFLNLYYTKVQNYQFTIKPEGIPGSIPGGLTAVLEDKFLNTSTPLSLHQATVVPFSVTSDANSTGLNRFRIVFKRGGSAITGIENGEDWFTDGKQGVKVYPNPVTDDRINVQFNKMTAGKYEITLYNGKGAALITKSVSNDGNAASYYLALNNTMTAGAYTLTVRDDLGNIKHTQTVIIGK